MLMLSKVQMEENQLKIIGEILEDTRKVCTQERGGKTTQVTHVRAGHEITQAGNLTGRQR